MAEAPPSSFSDSKKHLLVLDALRGVAAVMVLVMHTFELFCKGDYTKMFINHGYLAVDFFFMLSGYVMAHAYDDRWDRMTVWDFCKRRLIRLHPLIILGMVLGALTFSFQASPVFPKVADATGWQILLTMLVGFTLIPIPPSLDIRGWDEMHPLNGPAWSLFFEYIANILHVFVLRRLPNLVLSMLVLLAGILLVRTAVLRPQGDLIGGWSLAPEQLSLGFTRLLFPYMAGMLLRRVVRLGKVSNLSWLAVILLIAVLSFPRVGPKDQPWMNGLYESAVVVIVFPIIIYLGAISEAHGAIWQRSARFLGDISYPLYITHFPLMCVYYAWVSREDVTMAQGAPVGILLMVVSIALAYLWLRVYDIPVRRWLASKFMRSA